MRIGNSREYFCCICKVKLEEKPLRLNFQEFGAGNYNQYYTTASYDFCPKCYHIFAKWLKKHEAISNQELIAKNDTFCIDT